jgi:hypothetical protein
MTDDEMRAFIERIRHRGVTFEVAGEQWRVPRRLLSAHEAETLRTHADAVHRALLATKPEQEEQEATAVGGPTTESLSHPSAAATQLEPEPEPHPTTLPRDKWEAAGIEVIDGIPSHSRGDQFAAAVIDGTVPYDEAVRQRRATERMLEQMEYSRRRGAFDVTAAFTGGHRWRE